MGSLIIAPSTIFLAAWTEGDWRNYNASYPETNYPGGMITLSRAPYINMTSGTQAKWVRANTFITLKIYKENGIGAYCGFPGSDTSDAHTYFNSDINYGGLNANLRDRDERFLIITNYTQWPSEYPMAIHSWPSQRHSGLKSRLLPNVSYYVPTWPSMGPGCSNQQSGAGGCNGHGQCDWCRQKCSCFQGWGSSMDLLVPGFKAPGDCSVRTCPAGVALADVALTATVAHRMVECSNAGMCNRQTGECLCFAPWTGAACDRMRCPNDCSGHGKCLSIHQVARLASIAGGHPASAYYGHSVNYGTGTFQAGPGGEEPTSMQNFSTTEGAVWDKDRMRTCVCDSFWPVGLGADQRQLSEWFGPDCSKRHCPSGDDPFTAANELHCNGMNQLSAFYPEKGHIGNYCQVDCSNRGVCDYSTGKCTCFKGSYGDNCAVTARTGVYRDAASAPNEEYLPPQSDLNYATQQIELAKFY